jgi:hypothetical protein
MLLEPGDFVRLGLNSSGIDGVFDVLENNIHPGTMDGNLVLSDARGWRDNNGFWTEDTFNFPVELGGAAVTAWDKTWTDEQKAYARENWGFWTDDDGYIDQTDPLQSFKKSRWT